MAFGTAYVNARNLRKQQQAERDRIANERKRIAEAAAARRQQAALARAQMAQQASQFQQTLAYNKQQAAQSTKLAGQKMALQQEQASTQKAQFNASLDYSQSQLAQQQKESAFKQDIAQRQIAVDEGRLDIAQQGAAQAAKRNEMVSKLEDTFMQQAFQATAPQPMSAPSVPQAPAAQGMGSGAQPRTAAPQPMSAPSVPQVPTAQGMAAPQGTVAPPAPTAQGMGSPQAAQAQVQAPKKMTKEQTREFMMNAAQAYASIGETDRADALMKIMDRKEADEFRSNTQEFMRGLQYLNGDDTDKAAKSFSKIINDTGLYGEEYSIDPESFSGPSEETGGAFTFDLVSDNTGERLTQSYQNQEEMIGFLLGNANPVKALEFTIENSDTFRERSAKVMAKHAEIEAGRAEAQRELMQDAIDYASKEVERRASPMAGGIAYGEEGMPEEERDALFNTLIEDYMRRIQGASGMGSPAMQ